MGRSGASQLSYINSVSPNPPNDTQGNPTRYPMTANHDTQSPVRSNSAQNPVFIVVVGLPASGKTTLARKIAARTGIALLEKDAIKERLFDTLGWSNRDWSRQLGAATWRVMDYLIEAQLQVGNWLIVEATFDPRHDTQKIRTWVKRFGIRVIQVLCYAEGQILLHRFTQRAHSPERHPGQDRPEQLPDLAEQLSAGRAEFLDVEGPRIEWDTTTFNPAAELRVLDTVLQETQRIA